MKNAYLKDILVVSRLAVYRAMASDPQVRISAAVGRQVIFCIEIGRRSAESGSGRRAATDLSAAGFCDRREGSARDGFGQE